MKTTTPTPGAYSEPWSARPAEDAEDGAVIEFYPEMSDEAVSVAFVDACDENGGMTVASRIVACVNAFAGIEDPARFMEDVRAVLRLDLHQGRMEASVKKYRRKDGTIVDAEFRESPVCDPFWYVFEQIGNVETHSALTPAEFEAEFEAVES